MNADMPLATVELATKASDTQGITASADIVRSTTLNVDCPCVLGGSNRARGGSRTVNQISSASAMPGIAAIRNPARQPHCCAIQPPSPNVTIWAIIVADI